MNIEIEKPKSINPEKKSEKTEKAKLSPREDFARFQESFSNKYNPGKKNETGLNRPTVDTATKNEEEMTSYTEEVSFNPFGSLKNVKGRVEEPTILTEPEPTQAPQEPPAVNTKPKEDIFSNNPFASALKNAKGRPQKKEKIQAENKEEEPATEAIEEKQAESEQQEAIPEEKEEKQPQSTQEEAAPEEVETKEKEYKSPAEHKKRGDTLVIRFEEFKKTHPEASNIEKADEAMRIARELTKIVHNIETDAKSARLNAKDAEKSKDIFWKYDAVKVDVYDQINSLTKEDMLLRARALHPEPQTIPLKEKPVSQEPNIALTETEPAIELTAEDIVEEGAVDTEDILDALSSVDELDTPTEITEEAKKKHARKKRREKKTQKKEGRRTKNERKEKQNKRDIRSELKEKINTEEHKEAVKQISEALVETYDKVDNATIEKAFENPEKSALLHESVLGFEIAVDFHNLLEELRADLDSLHNFYSYVSSTEEKEFPKTFKNKPSLDTEKLNKYLTQFDEYAQFGETLFNFDENLFPEDLHTEIKNHKTTLKELSSKSTELKKEAETLFKKLDSVDTNDLLSLKAQADTITSSTAAVTESAFDLDDYITGNGFGSGSHYSGGGSGASRPSGQNASKKPPFLNRMVDAYFKVIGFGGKASP